MTAKHIMVSVSQEIKDYLDANRHLSPSKLIQEVIEDLMLGGEQHKLVAERKKLKGWMDLCYDMRAFMLKRGVHNDWTEQFYGKGGKK